MELKKQQFAILTNANWNQSPDPILVSDEQDAVQKTLQARGITSRFLPN